MSGSRGRRGRGTARGPGAERVWAAAPPRPAAAALTEVPGVLVGGLLGEDPGRVGGVEGRGGGAGVLPPEELAEGAGHRRALLHGAAGRRLALPGHVAVPVPVPVPARPRSREMRATWPGEGGACPAPPAARLPGPHSSEPSHCRPLWHQAGTSPSPGPAPAPALPWEAAPPPGSRPYPWAPAGRGLPSRRRFETRSI